VNSPPPKPEVILTNFFAEPTVLLVPITSRDIDTNKRWWHGPTTPLFSNFLFTNLFSIKCLYFFIISSLSCSRNAPCTLNLIIMFVLLYSTKHLDGSMYCCKRGYVYMGIIVIKLCTYTEAFGLKRRELAGI
jgi:hypothetical protein